MFVDFSKRITIGYVPVFFLVAACLILLVVPASAYAHPYSVLSWSDSPPTVEAKLPVPVDVWQVPPAAMLLVVTAVFLPVCLVPVEILISCAGFVALNFRRIRKTEVFENDCRMRIYHHIVANPGSGFAGIMQSLPVNRGTLHYHLRVLCRERLIVAFSINNSICYFQNAGIFSDTEMDAIARLRNRVNLSICTFLASIPDASRQDIAGMLKTTGSTVSWHMHRLCEARLITSVREGRNVRYRLTPVAAKVIDELQ